MSRYACKFEGESDDEMKTWLGSCVEEAAKLHARRSDEDDPSATPPRERVVLVLQEGAPEPARVTVVVEHEPQYYAWTPADVSRPSGEQWSCQ